MNLIGIINDAVSAAKDPNRRFTERIFLIFGLMTEITVSIAFIGDILTRESPYEILVIVWILLSVPVITLICLRWNKLRLAINILVISLVFAIIPALFFLGEVLKGAVFSG